jgi:hypothetical protein
VRAGQPAICGCGRAFVYPDRHCDVCGTTLLVRGPVRAACARCLCKQNRAAHAAAAKGRPMRHLEPRIEREYGDDE